MRAFMRRNNNGKKWQRYFKRCLFRFPNRKRLKSEQKDIQMCKGHQLEKCALSSCMGQMLYKY